MTFKLSEQLQKDIFLPASWKEALSTNLFESCSNVPRCFPLYYHLPLPVTNLLQQLLHNYFFCVSLDTTYGNPYLIHYTYPYQICATCNDNIIVPFCCCRKHKLDRQWWLGLEIVITNIILKNCVQQSFGITCCWPGARQPCHQLFQHCGKPWFQAFDQSHQQYKVKLDLIDKLLTLESCLQIYNCTIFMDYSSRSLYIIEMLPLSLFNSSVSIDRPLPNPPNVNMVLLWINVMKPGLSSYSHWA